MPEPRKVAIVTGAARGIGAAIAQRLVADGHAVAVLDLDEAGASETAKILVASGGDAIAIRADVSDEEAVQRAVDRTAAELGPPTVLVNNAGMTRDNLIFRMSASEWDQVLDVHLKGSFLMTRSAQKHMVDAKWGRIVNISSTAALGNRGQVNYSAAKAGIQGFTKSLAIELGPFGVTANCVAPGFIVGEMQKVTAERMGISWEEHAAARAALTPVRRVGQGEDIANAVAFFADDRAGFVSGQVQYVAGGPRA
jgi:3-oxoacyl-[acyl-carrier protein] reductase